MEQCKLPVITVTEKHPLPDRLSVLEWSLLRRFRQLRPADQAVVFKMMEGLAALTDQDN